MNIPKVWQEENSRVAALMETYKKSIREGADPVVLEFIARFRARGGEDKADVLRQVFLNGYCYYFAVILQTAFRRGQPVLAAPRGHIVWQDVDGACYDIDGVYNDHWFAVPLEEMGDGIEDFMHVPGKTGFNSKEDVVQICKKCAPSETALKSALDELGF